MNPTNSAELKAHLNKLYSAGFYNNIIKYFEEQGITGVPITTVLERYEKELADCPENTEAGDSLIFYQHYAESISFNENSSGKNIEFIFSPAAFAKFLVKNFNYDKKMLEFNNKNLSGKKILKINGKIIVINSENDE